MFCLQILVDIIDEVLLPNVLNVTEVENNTIFTLAGIYGDKVYFAIEHDNPSAPSDYRSRLFAGGIQLGKEFEQGSVVTMTWRPATRSAI